MGERTWLEKLEKGEDSAFQVLFRLFYARLCSFACRYIGDQAASEDVVQDVICELWERKLHFENETALKACLYDMTRNRCLDVLKHRKVEEKYAQELCHQEKTEFFLQQFLEDEVYAELKKEIEALPLPMRRVFELALERRDNAEIAEILHLSVDAVKAHKKRGKKILQERMRGMVLWYALFKI